MAKAPAPEQPLFVVYARFVWPTSTEEDFTAGPMWEAHLQERRPHFLFDAADDANAFALRDWSRNEAWQPIRAFTDVHKAEAYAERVDAEIRKTCNPFVYGSQIRDWSSFDEPRLCDWLMDAGLDLPKLKKGKKRTAEHWRQWWTEQAPAMTALQRAKVWEALDKVRFHKVETFE